MSKKMKRCAIYLFYDKDGIVDDCNIYWLKAIKEHVEHLLVVCNGTLKKSGHDKFNSVADEVLLRENLGMDVGGYKAGIKHIGFDALKEYDEIILMNYTFFGPLFPLNEMFDTMTEKEIDFWGITTHAKVDEDPFGAISYGYLPRHIQSYFLVLRKSLFISDSFQQYWKELKIPVGYLDSITQFETVFTQKFADDGFKWAAYMDTDDLEKDTYCPVMYYPRELIEKRRCPIIKRRIFFHNYNDVFSNTCGESYMLAYEYVRDHLDYDVNMIWDNILRLENMSDINKALHQNYFLSSTVSTDVEQKKVCAVFYLNTCILVPICLQYLKNLPEYTDIYFICSENIVKERVEKLQVAYSQYNCKIIVDEGAINLDCAIKNIDYSIIKDYNLVCLINASSVGRVYPISNATSWLRKSMKNLLPSKQFVDNVISTFDSEKRLGLLSPYPPNHGIYYQRLDDCWEHNVSFVKTILKNCGIDVNINVDKKPIAPYGGACWFRPNILKTFCKCNEKQEVVEYFASDTIDISVIGCTLPFLAQGEGFYSGWLFNDEDARIEFTNLEYMMRENNEAIFKKWGPGLLEHIPAVIQSEPQDIIVVQTGWKRKTKDLLINLLPPIVFVFAKKCWFKMKGITYTGD